MIELFGWTSMVLAVAGVVLNNRRMIACFWLWMASNALSGMVHCEAAIWSLAVRDGVFFLLAIEGWLLWRIPKKQDR